MWGNKKISSLSWWYCFIDFRTKTKILIFCFYSLMSCMKKSIIVICSICLQALMVSSVFATVQPATGEWFGSAKIVTDEWWIALSGTDWAQEGKLIDAIKWFINWTLWILWLIAVIMILRWWLRMVLAWWNEDTYNKWFTIVKNAALGLVIIGLARFIASIIFWITNLVTKESLWWWAWTTSIVMPYIK